jgi:hypothetical protein
MAIGADGPETGDDPYIEARRRALEDGGGFPTHLAETALSGVDTDVPNVPSHRPRTPSPRTSRRGGRSYPEASDRDIDLELQGDDSPLSEEDKANRHADYLRASQELARALAVIHLDEQYEAAQRHGVSPQAILYARQQRAARQEH